MDSSSDDEGIVLALLLLARAKSKRKRRKRIALHPIHKVTSSVGLRPKIYPNVSDEDDEDERQTAHPSLISEEEDEKKQIVYPSLMDDYDDDDEDEDLFNLATMTKETFEDLLSTMYGSIRQMQTNFKKPISPRKRLIITLKFLATGETARSLHHEFNVGESTIRLIVYDTCEKLWAMLQPTEMPALTPEKFKEIAEGFRTQCHFPHVVGVIDEKHIQVQRPANTSSLTCPQNLSLVLQAVSDADSLYIAVDIGEGGARSDGGVLRNSSFGQALINNELPLPAEESIEDSEPFPYFFVGDEAYPLRTNLMRPYPARFATPERKVFNYRHSLAQGVIERTFGLMCSKWCVLEKRLNMSPENAAKVTLACCVLHNFVQRREGKESTAPLQGAKKRSFAPDRGNSNPTAGRPSQASLALRDRLCDLFVHKLPIQGQPEHAIIPVP